MTDASNSDRLSSAWEAGGLADENALLRASLAEMLERVGELERQDERDTLTPLPNRRRFVGELERVASQAARHGTPAALLHIDIDGLDAINGRHGRPAGDAALIHVARTLKGLIRSTDILGRLDDDAFGLILDHLDHNSAIETAGRLARRVADQPLDLGNAEVAIGLSIGIATILPGDGADDVLRRAEHNLKAAKDER